MAVQETLQSIRRGWPALVVVGLIVAGLGGFLYSTAGVWATRTVIVFSAPGGANPMIVFGR